MSRKCEDTCCSETEEVVCETKVECRYCHGKFVRRGFRNHLKRCYARESACESYSRPTRCFGGCCIFEWLARCVLDCFRCCGSLLQVNLLTLAINLLIVLVMLAITGALLYENANSVAERVSSQIRETLVQGQAVAERAVELKQDLSSSLQNLPKIAALGNVKL